MTSHFLVYCSTILASGQNQPHMSFRCLPPFVCSADLSLLLTGSLEIRYPYLRIDDQLFLGLLKHQICDWHISFRCLPSFVHSAGLRSAGLSTYPACVDQVIVYLSCDKVNRHKDPRTDDQLFFGFLWRQIHEWVKPTIYFLQVLTSICLLSRHVHTVTHRLIGYISLPNPCPPSSPHLQCQEPQVTRQLYPLWGGPSVCHLFPISLSCSSDQVFHSFWDT